MAKPGCGPMAGFIIGLVVLLAIGSNEAIGFYFSHCDEEDLLDCILAELGDEEPESEGGVVATGVYTYKDYPATITMNIPLDGGNVTGSISGTCDGSVKGTFNSQSGLISGKISGTCDPLIVKVPASADFNGSVNKTGKTVPMSFSARGGGMTHDGSMTLTYQ